MAEFIPAKFARIYWNHDDSCTPGTVFVCDARDAQCRQMPRENYTSWMGNGNASWCVEDGRSDSPEGLFASIWINSPNRPTLEDYKSALKEFGKIDACEWARKMHSAIQHDSQFGYHNEPPED